MPYTYNDQLIETVGVRRRRLLQALLFGRRRARQTWDERVGGVLVGAFLAALLCAGCVAFSFVMHLVAQDPFMHQRPATTTQAPSPTASAQGAAR